MKVQIFCVIPISAFKYCDLHIRRLCERSRYSSHVSLFVSGYYVRLPSIMVSCREEVCVSLVILRWFLVLILLFPLIILRVPCSMFLLLEGKTRGTRQFSAKNDPPNPWDFQLCFLILVRENLVLIFARMWQRDDRGVAIGQVRWQVMTRDNLWRESATFSSSAKTSCLRHWGCLPKDNQLKMERWDNKMYNDLIVKITKKFSNYVHNLVTLVYETFNMALSHLTHVKVTSLVAILELLLLEPFVFFAILQ